MKRIYWESGFEVWTLKSQSMFFFFCNFFLVVVPRNVKRPSSYFSTKGTWSFVATFSHAEPIGLAPPHLFARLFGDPFQESFRCLFLGSFAPYWMSFFLFLYWWAFTPFFMILQPIFTGVFYRTMAPLYSH